MIRYCYNLIISAYKRQLLPKKALIEEFCQANKTLGEMLLFNKWEFQYYYFESPGHNIFIENMTHYVFKPATIYFQTSHFNVIFGSGRKTCVSCDLIYVKMKKNKA